MEKQESDLINFVLQSDSNNHNLKHIIDEIEKLPYYPSQHLREVIWEKYIKIGNKKSDMPEETLKLIIRLYPEPHPILINFFRTPFIHDVDKEQEMRLNLLDNIAFLSHHIRSLCTGPGGYFLTDTYLIKYLTEFLSKEYRSYLETIRSIVESLGRLETKYCNQDNFKPLERKSFPEYLFLEEEYDKALTSNYETISDDGINEMLVKFPPLYDYDFSFKINPLSRYHFKSDILENLNDWKKGLSPYSVYFLTILEDNPVESFCHDITWLMMGTEENIRINLQETLHRLEIQKPYDDPFYRKYFGSVMKGIITSLMRPSETNPLSSYMSILSQMAYISNLYQNPIPISVRKRGREN